MCLHRQVALVEDFRKKVSETSHLFPVPSILFYIFLSLKNKNDLDPTVCQYEFKSVNLNLCCLLKHIDSIWVNGLIEDLNSSKDSKNGK